MGAKAKTKASVPPKPAESKLAGLGRAPAAYVAASLAVLIPCFWQARIQAGDLSSHVYNAWLAQSIAKGQAPGLAVTGQTTNVVFDLLLDGLLQTFGAAAAQRIAVALAVVVFFWGAFAFVAAVSRRPWPVTPALAALAYGFVFHMGFFNFYLSLGLCFWALALVWNAPARSRRWPAAVTLAALAYAAHGLPLAWAAGVLAYYWMWRRLGGRARAYLLGGSLATVVLLRAAIVAKLPTRWFTAQIWRTTGADQLWVFGDKYTVLAGALVAVWAWIALSGRENAAADSAAARALGPIAILTAAGVFLIPNGIWIPGYNHQLAYIAQRMSLPLGVVICGWAAARCGAGRSRPWQAGALGAIALLFFGFLYGDEKVLNDFEDQVDQVVAQLPPGQRVVLSVEDDDIQVNALTHMIDRACIGRCWSYANYEPSSGQFRVRVAGATSVVAATDADSMAFDDGSYVVKPRDLPLVQIVVNNAGRLVVREPPAGSPIGITRWSGL